MDKKIIVLLLILGVILSGCKIAEKQTEEPAKIEKQGTQEPIVKPEEAEESVEEELNETIVPEEETEETNITGLEEKVFIIEIDRLKLSQKYVTIEKGTTIVWENKEKNKHKLTLYGLVQSPILYQGDSFNYTFNEVGEYVYVCAIFKRQIRGTINVEENP